MQNVTEAKKWQKTTGYFFFVCKSKIYEVAKKNENNIIKLVATEI